MTRTTLHRITAPFSVPRGGAALQPRVATTTSIMQPRRHRRLLASTLTISVQFLFASTAVAEEDHLKG